MAHVIESSTLEIEAVARRLQGEGWDALAPMYEREVRHARRIEKRRYPLYGRYLFAWFDPQDMGRILRVRGVAGVLRRAGSRLPAVVSDAVVEGIDETVRLPEFEVGDELVVVRGRMEGMRGLFARREEDRVFLLLSLLGKEVEMPFPVKSLSKSEI